MGYSHYWELTGNLTKTEKQAILLFSRMIVGEFSQILREEFDSDAPPTLTERLICFNGVGNEGHETFHVSFKKDSGGWVKTNRKAYDLPVCMVLAVTKAFAGDRFELRSDGFGTRSLYLVNDVVEFFNPSDMQSWGFVAKRLEKWGFKSLFVLLERRTPDVTVTLKITPPFQIG